MITIQEFINQNNNQYISLLKPGKQCFDLVVKWTDNLGIPHAPGNPSPFPVQYAYEIYTKFGPFQSQYFDRIYNDPNAVAKPGDVIVWSGKYNGGVGHTALCTKADLFTLECFSQNDPTGSKCIIRGYKYDNILGFLRPKNYSPIQPINDTQKVNAITIIMQSAKSNEQKVIDSKKILGL